MSIIQTLSSKKLRPIRLGFSRYLVDKYAMSMSTAYQKIRNNRVKQWELIGISGCVAEFMPEYEGELCDFYKTLSKKSLFAQYMKDKGMSISTVYERFRKFDFTEIELKGFNEIYKEYKKQMED